MATRHLYLVRHGQRETGPGPDALGPGLTVLGWKQAHQAARRLAKLKIDVIHTSSLRRTMETAQILAVEQASLPIRPSRLLWECIPALPETVWEWFKAHPEPAEGKIPEAILPWRAIWGELGDPEQLVDDFEQAREAWKKYFIPAKGKDRHDIIVCHGNLIRYFVVRALNAPPESWIQMDIYNCSISEVAVETDGRARLVSHNESGHLSADQVTLF
jgi:serine/threonine-protein phosphatase PGAM5